MTPFSFHRPATLNEAVSLLGESERQAKVLAGGQSLLLALKERVLRPDRIMSIASLPNMTGVVCGAGGALEIGPATTYATLSTASIAGWHGEIAAVSGNLADRSVRNLGTIGGALCDANPRYDMPTLMVAANATFKLASASGERMVAAQDFFLSSGGTVLEPSELLVEIIVPPLVNFDGLAFEKFRHRVFDAAVLTVGCAIKFDAGGTIRTARIVIGNIEKAPALATVTAASLMGRARNAVDPKAVARDVGNELMSRDSLTTRQRQFQAELIISLTARALTRLLDCGRK